MQAICRLEKNVQEPGTSDAATLRGLVREVMAAVRESRIRLTCCFVKFLPFATDGELMPVQLPCGCTMSRAAARVAVKSGACQLCNDDVNSNTVCDVHRAVLRVVQAERWGISVPEIPRSRLMLGSLLGQGAQGSVYKAVLMAEDGGRKRDVAVNVVPIPDRVEAKDVGSLEQVVATTHLASRSPHICKMFGVSWAQNNVWCECCVPSLCCAVSCLPHLRFLQVVRL